MEAGQEVLENRNRNGTKKAHQEHQEARKAYLKELEQENKHWNV